MIEAIKNYDYKTKYNQTIEQIADISKDSKIFNTINKTWSSIFIQTDANQLENISFNIRKGESIKLQSQITDYVLENNTNTQNHITLQPLEITLRGEFGEVVRTIPRKNIVNKTIQEKINPIGLFNSDLEVKAQRYINKVEDLIEKVDNLFYKVGKGFDYLANLMNQLPTQQQKAFYSLMMFWKMKILVNVKTEFYQINNMVIKSIEFTQGEETINKSEAVITLKQMNFSQEITIKATSKYYNKGAPIQKKDELNSTLYKANELNILPTI